MNTIDRIATAYGVREDNGLIDPDNYHAGRVGQEYMGLKGLASLGGRVTRLRFLTSENLGGGRRGWDVSYCHAVLPDGTPVEVTDAPLGIDGTKRDVMGALIDWAKSEGVYAKGLGLLDQSNWSVLYG